MEEEVGGEKHKLLANRFSDGPQYVIVGAQPAVEIRRVTNLKVENDDLGTETISWEEATPDGGHVRRRETVKPVAA
jgi:hypothetical protein